MNERQLLINREYNLNQGRVNWYSALEKLREFPSVERVDFYDTCSSAGDWSGYIVQKIGDRRYLILFSQDNNWPCYGFTVYTGEVIASWSGKLTEDDILSIINLENQPEYIPDDGFSDGGEPYTDEELDIINKKG